MRRLGIGLPICAVVLLALLVPGAATAAGPCGSTILKGHRFTYKVISGSATCAEARYALGWWIGAFGSKSGYPPGWTCFNAHGNALLVSKEVAHCYRPNGLNPESVAKLFDRRSLTTVARSGVRSPSMGSWLRVPVVCSLAAWRVPGEQVFSRVGVAGSSAAPSVSAVEPSPRLGSTTKSAARVGKDGSALSSLWTSPRLISQPW
jgi:hypothetical protein